MENLCDTIGSYLPTITSADVLPTILWENALLRIRFSNIFVRYTYLFHKTKNSMFDLLGQLNSHFLIFCVENDSRRNFAIFAFWHDWRISSNSARFWIFVSYVWSDCHLHILILNKRWHDQKYWPQMSNYVDVFKNDDYYLLCVMLVFFHHSCSTKVVFRLTFNALDLHVSR